MMQRRHLYHLPKRAVCGALALLMAASTALTGCGAQGITTHALEDGHSHDAVEIVSDETVSLRETLADSLDPELAKQAAEIGEVYWENDVPADEEAVKNEYRINEGETEVPEIKIGTSVELSSAKASTVEKGFDENGLRETAFELKVMYTTVDADYLEAGSVTEMWNDNYEAFIANYNMMQHLYEVKGMDDVYVAFVNFSALNGTEGQIVSADFTRGTEKHPIDMESQVVLDKENGVLYVPKAWYFAGDGTEVGLDLSAQVMVAVDIHNDEMTDENGNLLANVSVSVENDADADIILQDGQYPMIAYDYAVLPLFSPGSIADLDSDEIEVYINGSAEPLKAEDLAYSVSEGKLTIKKAAMTVTEVKVVMKGRTILQSMASLFSIGGANAASLSEDHAGMVPIYNVTTGQQLNPDIDIDSLTVGDVLAYETIGNYGSRYAEVYNHMWANGCSNFVYTSNWEGGMSRSDTYWSFVGNKNFNTGDMEYSLGSKDNYGFIIELPFSSTAKTVADPVIIRSSGNKLTMGSTVYFGKQDDWKWTNENYNAGEVQYNYSIPGQCSHTDNSTYLSGAMNFTNMNSAPDATGGNVLATIRKPYNSTVTAATTISGVTWYPAASANGWYKSSANGVPVNYVTDYWQWGTITPNMSSSSDTTFRCYCDCTACDNYRKNNFLAGGERPDFCDANCPNCSSGLCDDCRTDWISNVSAINAQATCRILVIADGYMILGFAQLDSGDCQRGSCVIKVRTSVRVGVHKNVSGTLNGGTVNNPCYGNVLDAEYSVYKDPACTQFVGKVTADGEDLLRMPRGTYYFKETKAPVGYYMDTANYGYGVGVHKEEVKENCVFEYYDTPMHDPVIAMVQKNVQNRDTAGITTGDVGPLSGIQFDVSFYKGEYNSLESLAGKTADEHAVFQTDAYGLLSIDDAHLVKGQTWQYRDTRGYMVFPMGTVMIKEKSSIDGLLIYNTAGMLFKLTDLSDKTSDRVRQDRWTDSAGNVVPAYHGTITTIVGSSHKQLTADRVAGSYENGAVKGGVTVWKADLDWEKSDVQGDVTTLAGAEFTIYNRSASSVYYDGKIYEPGQAITVIKTSYDSANKCYTATTGPYMLEYGTYEIKETKAPTGYNLASWSKEFTIRENGQMHLFTRTNAADTVNGSQWLHRWCADAVMRGGVAFGKVDRETKQYYSLGSSSLVGSTFALYNRSSHPVYVNGKTYAVNAKIMDFTAREMTITMETGVEGYTKTIIGNTTGNHVLPYGSYEIIETGTGIGYLYDSNSKAQSKRFSIRSEGDMHYFTDEGDAFHNKVQREDWYFSKKADDSGHEMPKVAWTVTSVTTGETHIIVTDENGKYQSDQVAHTQRTNANDPDSPISNGAVKIDENGDYYVANASKLDYDAGTWFTGVNPAYVTWNRDGKSYTVNLGTKDVYGTAYTSTGTVDDTLRAYPYDTYLVQELPSDANEGYNLVNFLVTLKRYNSDPDSNGIILDYGTVDDQRVDIFTNLGYTPTKFSNTVKYVPCDEKAELIDVITYSGLTEGNEYVMKGAIHLVDENGKDLGIVASNEMAFTAKAAGQLKMSFTVDTMKCCGKVLVATEAIYQDGTLLTEETDLTNIDQSVIVDDVELSTYLGYRPDRFSNSIKYLPSNKEVEIVDTITYSGLAYGDRYVAKGEIHLLDEEDNDLGVIATNEMTFTAGTSGELEMPFTVDTTDRYGLVMVATEGIYKNGTLVASENDLTSTEQSVIVHDLDLARKPVKIKTFAVNGATNTKELAAEADQSIFECIKLSNMKVDGIYKLEGSIYWIDDIGHARAIRDAENNPIVITIDSPEDEETMTFTGIDASKFGGHDVVVYQNLYEFVDDEWEIAASHCDNTNADQTVHVPAISGTPAGDPDLYPEFEDMPNGGTLLLGSEGIHNDQTGSVTLTDKVACVNLTPGQKYVVNGTLHFREDAETEDGYQAVDMGEVEGVTGQTEFMADSRNMIVDVEFTFDASELDGKVVVAYEKLYSYTDAVSIPDKWAGYFTSVTGNADGPVLAASHADISDTAQSVGFGRITETTLTTSQGLHEAAPAGNVIFTDNVKYEGLIPGVTYTITGILYVQNPVDLTELEQLLERVPAVVNESTIGEWFAKVKAWADENEATEISEMAAAAVTAAENEEAEDVVRYRASLISMLNIWNEEHNKERSIIVTTEKSFIPETPNGELNVDFAFNADDLAGKTVVATETITCDGVFVAAHDDMDDEMQSVHFIGIDTVLYGFEVKDGNTEDGADETPDDAESGDTAESSESEVSKLIDGVPELDDKDALSDWFSNVKSWASRNGADEIEQAAGNGIFFIMTENRNEQYRRTVLSLLKTWRDDHAGGVTQLGEPVALDDDAETAGNTDDNDSDTAVSDELFNEIQSLIDEGNKTAADDKPAILGWFGKVQEWANGQPDRTEESQATAISVECGYGATAVGDDNYEDIVKYRSSVIEMLLNYSKTENGDGVDEQVPEGEPTKTVRFKVYSGAQEIFGIGQLQAESFKLMDTVTLTNLTPGTEYTLLSEVHLRSQVGNAKVDMCNLNFNETTTFTAEESEQTINVMFTINPLGIQEADIVAYEYLYQGDSLLTSHADITDDDQAVHVIGELQKDPIEGEKPEKNPCGCNDPECKHKDEQDHCVNNPGCCDDTDCCTTCNECKGKNPCGCDDPDCKHKDEKNHCVNNPGCCDDSDCCKECEDCKGKNPCGCNDPDCKHKDEKDHCVNNPGCCDDSDCCKDCDECLPKNPCGCDDPTCKHKDEKDHCVDNPGCCDDSDCCKGCDDCKQKNPCGCNDPDCMHKNEKNHCVNNPGCCDDAKCCKDCKECKSKNLCGCDDPDCKHKNEKNHCVNNLGCCDDSDCCKDCKTCKSKNLCGCNDLDCMHKNEKNHCVNNPGCCDDAKCCKSCSTCKSKNLCGCDDADCKHKNEKNHCVNNPGCCDDAKCCTNCKTCKSKPVTTQTTTKNPVEKIVEIVKTGENDFLLFGLIGLVILAGGGFLFFGKTEKGRSLLKKLREKFRK